MHEGLSSPAQPLTLAARKLMESRFGYDLGRVRIHAGGHAARSARTVNARAYAVGADIVFGAGEYSSETQSGRQLLAHELAHVVQQSRGGGTAPAPWSGGALERDARAAAAGFDSGSGPMNVAGACAPGFARDLPRSLTETLNPTELSFEEREREIMLLTEWLEQQTTSTSETDRMSQVLQQLQQARPATDPRHARGLFGEQEMAFRGYRAEDGWAVIEGPSGAAGHGVTTSGFDAVAYNVRTGELHIVDNKSFARPGNVSSATAIERNLLRNLENLITRVESTSPHTLPPREEVLRLLRQTRAALRGGGRIPDRVQLTVTAAGGQSTGVTARLARRGIRFRDLSAVEAAPPGTARPPLEGGSAAAPVPEEPAASPPASSPSPPEAIPPPAPTASETAAPPVPSETTAPSQTTAPATEETAPSAATEPARVREPAAVPETPVSPSSSPSISEPIATETPGIHAAGVAIALGIHQYLVQGLQEAEERRAQAALHRLMPHIEQLRQQGEWVEVRIVMDEPESREILGQVTGFTEPGQIARFYTLMVDHASTREALGQTRPPSIEAVPADHVPAAPPPAVPEGRVLRTHPYRIFEPFRSLSDLSPDRASASPATVLPPASERRSRLLRQTDIPADLAERSIRVADLYVAAGSQATENPQSAEAAALGQAMRGQLAPYDLAQEGNQRLLAEALALQGLPLAQIESLLWILLHPARAPGSTGR